MLRISASSLQRPVWTFSRCRVAASSKTPSSRRSGPQLTRIRVGVVTNVCPNTSRTSVGPFGRNLPATSIVRQALRNAGLQTPVVAAGGVHGFEEAERILNDGEADIIASARQSIADPDWFLKMKLGHGDDIRVCIFSNYCEALDTRHKQVTCELWDREDKNRSRRQTNIGRQTTTFAAGLGTAAGVMSR